LVASIGVAIPKNGYGYLSEHHAYGQDEETAGDYAEDLATAMLGSTLGIDVNPEVAWDERKNAYLMSGKIVHSQNITSTATVGKAGKWTTVMAAAVFIMR
jgi:arginine decarboxylase